MVVHEDWADAIVGVFRKLFRARFPIERLALADEFRADQRLLLANNVSSAFNCRFVTARRGVWSEHAYGAAVDINPLQNPYVNGDLVLPEAGRRYLDRSQTLPGMIHASGVVVRAFAEIGWEWGGSWRSLKDYQHFSATGR